MRVVEMCPWIFSNEIVSKGRCGRYGTLGYQGNTIHVRSSDLQNKINSQISILLRTPIRAKTK